jgi:glutamate formiminotransferase
MNKKLFEAVPNFSEGRNITIIDGIAAAMQSVPGAALLDYSRDANHNRSVYTLAGNAASLQQAMLRAYSFALENIDLRQHIGEHPCIGAVDVMPFIPLAGADMADAADLAASFAALIAKKLAIPCYLYGEAARTPLRQNLANIRRGGFNGLGVKMADDTWRPDFGPSFPHPSFGATAIGARFFLIAINFNLATSDIAIAKAIAKKIRASSGGFPEVKAIGVMLHDKLQSQVSCNLTDFRITSIQQVFDKVSQMAKEAGTMVTETEIIGLPPAAALTGINSQKLKLLNFDMKRVLENQLGRYNHG